MPNLFQRLGSGVKAAASAFSAMVFSRGGGWGSSWGSWSRGAHNYASEVGDGRGGSIVEPTLKWIGKNFGEAKPRVRRLGAGGKLEPVAMHPLTVRLRRPTPYYSGMNLWLVTLADWKLGDAYWLKIRSESGAVVELWWAPSWMMEPRWPEGADNTVFISHYEYSPNGRPLRIRPEDVVHFRNGIDPNNIRKGKSDLACVLGQVYSDDEASRYKATLLKNLGVPGMVISPAGDGSIPPEDAPQIKAEIMQKTTGEHRGEPLIMTTKTDVHQYGFSPEQMNVNSLHVIPETRVTAALGVAAIVVGMEAGLSHATYANMEAAQRSATENELVPDWRFFAEEIQAQLLPDFDDPAKSEFDFDISEVRALQEDQNALTERTKNRWLSCQITLNEARTDQGLESIGPEGDIYFVPINGTLTPLDQLGMVAPPPPTPSPATMPSEPPAKGLLDWPEHQVETKAADGWVTAMERLQARLQPTSEREILGFLTRQRNRVIASLDGQKAALAEVLDWAQEEVQFGQSMKAAYLRALNGTVQLTESYLGVDIPVSDALTQSYLKGAGARIGDITQTTKRAVQKALADAHEAGEGIEGMTARIQGLTQFNEARARMIARTELGESSMLASTHAFVVAGTVEAVQISDADGNDGAFTGCTDRHGKVVPLADAYSIHLLHPNCQVRISPVVRAPKSANGNGHGEHKELVGV